MIIDHIRNRALYYGLGERFEKGLDYLANYKSGCTENKDVKLDEEELFVRIRPILTKPVEECVLESHLYYADIHYVAKGTEKIGYADVSNLQRKSYDEKTDTFLFTGEFDEITLKEGYFCIALKDDAHAPCIMKECTEEVEKLIVKVKL